MSRYTIKNLYDKMAQGEKLAMVTAYDYNAAILAEQAGMDMLLIGDSLGNVMLGYDTTIPVTMADMLHHTKAVSRAAKKAFVVADLPFGAYHISEAQAIENALVLIQQGGAQAVKLEGGLEFAPVVKALTSRGIPVMAHLGLLPQTASMWQGYGTQGRDETAAWALVEAAQAMEEAGAFAILIECVAREAARLISDKVDIPTIGIGSGPNCDGQVLVYHDLLGLNQGYVPKFVKAYADIGAQIKEALTSYVAEVKQGAFPDDEHSVAMEEDEAQRLY